jgi:N-acetylneuraminic acid mutarotase
MLYDSSMRSLLLSLALVCAGGAAWAYGPGTLVVTAEPVNPGDNFEKDLKKAAKTSLKNEDGKWHVYFVAFLKKAPGAPELNLVFYDPSSKDKEPVNAYPFEAKADAKVVMSNVEISVDGGFKKGKKYELRVTRLVKGHEEVFAKTTLVLK